MAMPPHDPDGHDQSDRKRSSWLSSHPAAIAAQFIAGSACLAQAELPTLSPEIDEGTLV
jgi:hypothetical protein